LELIGRRVTAGREPEEEYALLLTLPKSKQEVVLERLAALDRYLSTPAAGTGEAQQAADRLGLSLRSFYRLLVRLRERGPVAALAPNFRIEPRAGAAVSGLSPDAEAALTELLAEEPGANWRRVIDHVTQSVPQPPSEAAIRRRLMALRGEGPPTREPNILFGADWLVDQCAVDVPVAYFSEIYRPIVTFAVDRQSRLILGAGVAFRPVDSEFSGALFLGLNDLQRRNPGVAGTPLRIAAHVQSVWWVVPPELLDDPAGVIESASSVSPPVTVKLISKGKFRHGSELVRLLGDRIGPLRLMVRATASNRLAGPPPGISPLNNNDFQMVVRQAIGQWNRELLLKLEMPMPDSLTRTGRRHLLLRLNRTLVEVFRPVLLDRGEFADNLAASQERV